MSNDKIVSKRNINQLLSNQDYKEYWELKENILKDYPPQKKRTREEHLECIKRIGDLLWAIDGPFQRFINSQVSEQIQLKQEQRANPKRLGRKTN
jgi:hypothetical protein